MKNFIAVTPDGVVDAFYTREDDAPELIVDEGLNLVELIGPTIVDFSGQPSLSHQLMWATEAGIQWVETLPLEDLKIRKNAEIDRARESANATYFDFANQRISCDDMSWKDIMSANAEIALTHQMPLGWVGGWKAKDKNPDGSPIFVPIPDVATWITFIQAMVNRGLTHFNKSQQLKNTLSVATTPEDVALINW